MPKKRLYSNIDNATLV